MMVCVACSGKRVDTKGQPCRPCNGTGEGNSVQIERIDREAINTQARAALAAFKALPCSTEAEFTQLSTGLVALKGHIKAVEARRDKALNHLKEAVKEITSWFKPGLDTLKEAEKDAKAKLVAYQQAQEAKRRALLPTIQAAHTQGDYATVVQAASDMQAAQPGEAMGVSFRETWTFEVADPALVPREFLSVDEKKLRARMREDLNQFDGPNPIPGVRFFKTQIVAARG